MGLAKSGFKGLGFVVVTLMALAFEAKASTGILMPMLIIADILAVVVYRKNVKWGVLLKLLPWMVIGVLIGVYSGDRISEEVFRKMMASIIIVSLVLMLIFEKMKDSSVPDSIWFSSLMGLSAGFTTMVGNLAGAFANLYFLALRFPKLEFIGTLAWLFFIINLFKLPFHVLVWKTVNSESLMYSLYLTPSVLIGFYIGLRLIRLFSNQLFRNYIIAITIIGSLMIFIK